MKKIVYFIQLKMIVIQSKHVLQIKKCCFYFKIMVFVFNINININKVSYKDKEWKKTF